LTPDLLETLHRVPLFTDLSPAELALIATGAAIRRFDAGVIVFSEGDPCRELWIVQDGSVRVLKTAANGRNQLIAIERAGGSLSEVPVFDGGSYPATAQTASAATLLRLDADVFLRVCGEHPPLALKVIKVLGHRLRRMSRLVEDLSFSTVRGRLIVYLVHLAEEEGSTTFELRENNEELAARIGTVRELVSRNLGRLHGEGWIVMQRRIVTIPDLRVLKEEASRA
jgi:CRP-like cAMP-binding protein